MRSGNFPYFWSCLYNSPFAANSRIRKTRVSSWKYPYSRKILGCLDNENKKMARSHEKGSIKRCIDKSTQHDWESMALTGGCLGFQLLYEAGAQYCYELARSCTRLWEQWYIHSVFHAPNTHGQTFPFPRLFQSQSHPMSMPYGWIQVYVSKKKKVQWWGVTKVRIRTKTLVWNIALHSYLFIVERELVAWLRCFDWDRALSGLAVAGWRWLTNGIRAEQSKKVRNGQDENGKCVTVGWGRAAA